jgi:protein-disulfide isomerase
VTVLVYADYECPHTRAMELAVARLRARDGNSFRYVFRFFPLRDAHPHAQMAAEAAECVFTLGGPDAFWKMHDLLYANQPSQEKQDGLKREALDGYAQQLGLDMNKWKTALDTQSHKAEVDADAKTGNDAGISGTPAFIINGYFINGAQPYAKFRKVIERALAEAK